MTLEWISQYRLWVSVALIVLAVLFLLCLSLWLSSRRRVRALSSEIDQFRQLDQQRIEQIHHLQNDQQHLQGQLKGFEALKDQHQKTTDEKYRFEQEVAVLKSKQQLTEQHLREQMQALELRKNEIKAEFEQLSRQVLGEQSKQVGEVADQQLKAWLAPLKEQMAQFQRKVDDVYLKDNEGRQRILTEIHHLKALNQQIGQEAVELTKALKTQSKTRGTWGELILEQVLQASGLRKGEEYETQVSIAQNQQRLIPDALIYLPDDKRLIVDAKVTLVDFEQYVNASDDLQRETAEQRFVKSTQARVKELADKHYPEALGSNALDMVIMFIPIESAFQMLIQHHPQLFTQALAQNVILTSPTTLLANLRVIEKLWQTQRQSDNAQQIADLASKLYDKITLFYESFVDIGDKLDKAHRAYDKAHNQLWDGRGSVLKQTQNMKSLGVSSKKQLPDDGGR